MSNDEKWLDELLDRTEKEEILDSVKRALDYLEELDVRKAYNVLELLYESLGGEHDAGKYVDEYEKNVKEVPHSHHMNLPDGSSYTVAMDQAIEDISQQTVRQVMDGLAQRMEERDKELADMSGAWEELSKRSEEKLAEIERDQAIYERLTGTTAMPEEKEEEEPWNTYRKDLMRGLLDERYR